MAIIDSVAAHQGWPLRGVPLYVHTQIANIGVRAVCFKANRGKMYIPVKCNDCHPNAVHGLFEVTGIHNASNKYMSHQ